MKNQKFTIWQNIDISPDDWRDGYIEETGEEEPEGSDVLAWAEELNAGYYDDERANLRRELGAEVLAFYDLGRWDGRRVGCCEVGHDLADVLNIFPDCEYIDIYGQDGEIKTTQHHHDGAIYATYRAIKNGLSWEQKQRFFEKLADGTATKNTVKYYTRSLWPDVADVYGWPTRRRAETCNI